MARFYLRGSIPGKILTAVCCALVAACLEAPVASAQHGGGHVGMGAAHGFARPSAPAPISRPRFRGGPPPAGFGAVRFHPHPIYPWRPIYPWHPIYPWRPIFPVYGYPFYFSGPYFYGCGAGWGFNPYWWPTCNVFWGWGLGYNPVPFYAYGSGPGYDAPPPSESPLYWYGDERRDLPELFLKDGTVLTVTDYWLVGGELHYKTMEGGKRVEHEVHFDELDLQRTIDVATARGFRFVLRNEPLERYFEKSPEDTTPAGPPPEN